MTLNKERITKIFEEWGRESRSAFASDASAYLRRTEENMKNRALSTLATEQTEYFFKIATELFLNEK